MGNDDESGAGKNELLEIYKLHVEMADRVSWRREGANRLFVTLLSAIAVFMAAVMRFGQGTMPTNLAVAVLAATGFLLAAAWYVTIRSYRQLNTGKFKVIHEMEERLAFSFYKREWELLDEGNNRGKYWKLTVVETFGPIIFAMLFVAIGILSVHAH